VAFVHALVADVRAAYDVQNLPTIIMGFSNGAAMAELLGCHSSYVYPLDARRGRLTFRYDLWVAHVATHYDASANYPSTCKSAQNPCAEWSAVGSDDYFIADLDDNAVEVQFSDLRIAQGCADEAALVETLADGARCYSYHDRVDIGPRRMTSSSTRVEGSR